ncbi:triose-phosphate isomerase [Alicyclobacillus macrosporangiidus]|jgi:triosephosphate isomerase|uniref:Triosephosphate isomerase n=1 Tax=Alicyclobacillus macrosporangiidus TaxID=392015 RepID=A0A1I7JSG0_9BACL|nr:triose-phosphate isomerase [Alicyclobacillus macrosporangiidus]SFU88078.1 triosephosphate isomerase (TIM) [Alicyclobacillus macrosporangiidus]
MTRRQLLAGNWKMNKTVAEARAFAEAIGRQADAFAGEADFAVCPPFTALHVLRVTLPARVALGAQNVYFEPKGAFTGEVSAEMLAEAGVRYVIVGHSERRHLFGETDALVGKKVEAVLGAGMTPILCVGEDLRERQLGHTERVVERQTKAALAGVDAGRAGEVVIAYEPVWAIGSGQTPAPEDAQRVVAHIRRVVEQEKGKEAAGRVRILYGGSVTADNIAGFTAQPDIDGALVGGASLQPDGFVRMAKAITKGASA